MARRFPSLHGEWPLHGGWPFDASVFHADRFEQPYHWRKPRKVGVCFMGDLFDTQVKFEWIDDVVNVMQDTKHTYFVLTKQPQNLLKWYRETNALGGGDWQHNIWWGVSCCDQQDANRMIPTLMEIPGNKWLSLEPLLDQVGLLPYLLGDRKSWPGWVVVGCHSHPKNNPCSVLWIQKIIQDCRKASIPVYVKQIDKGWGCAIRHPAYFPFYLRVREMPKEVEP
jgi:protein gp37